MQVHSCLAEPAAYAFTDKYTWSKIELAAHTSDGNMQSVLHVAEGNVAVTLHVSSQAHSALSR